jgi:transcriptional regulator with XRE-family HTH domain
VTTLTKKKLLDELKDKETRDIFVEEHVTTGIPFQLHALREKLGLSQSELARRAGMAQERISVLEDPNYEFIPKINTLLKLASVFDVPLIVKFGKWSELFQWETNLTPEDLAPETFDEAIEGLEETVSDTAQVASWNVSIMPRPALDLLRIAADQWITSFIDRMTVTPQPFQIQAQTWIDIDSLAVNVLEEEEEAIEGEIVDEEIATETVQLLPNIIIESVSTYPM